MFHKNCYIACNCNQTPTALHWGKNNLICYASCNSVIIYDPALGGGGKAVASLVSHTKRVNTVRWLGNGRDAETELISGAADNKIIVWNLTEQNWVAQVLNGHESHVNIVDGLGRGPENGNAVIASASMDFTVRIWRRPNRESVFSESQTLNLGNSVAVGLRLHLFQPENALILACALDTSNIQIYIEDNAEFSAAITLRGHEDWVRGLDFTENDSNLILASSSQDCYIRLWKFSPDSDQDSGADNQIVIRQTKYQIFVDSILAGHEGWIYSVDWSPVNLQLLSASLDKSLIIWKFDPETGLWTEDIRVGEVGGNTLGFYGAVFAPDGHSILAYSYHGAFHIWRFIEKENCWKPSVTIGGHFDQVTCLAWDPDDGEFVISTSTDQTTRIHAPWPKSADNDLVTWHEIARPQVHGYDLNSLALLSRYKFASAAEEKIIRVFEAPRNFIENFHKICKIQEDYSNIKSCLDSAPEGASVPSLGLSNKAVFINESTPENPNDPSLELSYFQPVSLTEPPTEETLLQNTLWPEIHKLYGHGYEVYTLAVSPDNKFLASACKATTIEHASLLLWDTTSWKLIQKLASHNLTVAQISFSPDSQRILTVSRDRRLSVFLRNENFYQLSFSTDKNTSIHTRIIWCCAWSHDSQYFVTGSRDGKVVIWSSTEYKAASAYLDLKQESVTALAFAPNLILKSYLVAVGTESGVVRIYTWNPEGWNQVLMLDRSQAHHLAVKKLAFRPRSGRAGHKNDSDNILQLASCSADHSLKIHDIVIE